MLMRSASNSASVASAGQAVVDVDPFGLNAEPGERVTLGGEVLGVGGDARVADQQLGHPAKFVPYAGRSPGISAGGSEM
jgi:hypothetical protein